MKTPEPLSTERLYELCAWVKMVDADSIVEVLREDLWALVEMAKDRNELLCATPAVKPRPSPDTVSTARGLFDLSLDQIP